MTHRAVVRGVGVSVGNEGPGAPAVVLEVRGELLPIYVSADQAQSMQLAMRGRQFERPLTHDLLVDMIAEFGGAIDQVRIDDLADGTFFAKIDAEQYVGGEGRELVFDARPSDAIAIALRADCPIIVSDAVVDRAGYQPEEFSLQGFDEYD
ncbi:bifunctional nuclease family protein [Haladaptatus sp. DJG-WS-42]|uniref:bifunctional nuclease family protein n=1 Tax=Haladaptatus sp. DJG-WS-42 TaxID=3120516 RepID=UPI0030D1E8FE